MCITWVGCVVGQTNRKLFLLCWTSCCIILWNSWTHDKLHEAVFAGLGCTVCAPCVCLRPRQHSASVHSGLVVDWIAYTRSSGILRPPAPPSLSLSLLPQLSLPNSRCFVCELSSSRGFTVSLLYSLLSPVWAWPLCCTEGCFRL